MESTRTITYNFMTVFLIKKFNFQKMWLKFQTWLSTSQRGKKKRTGLAFWESRLRKSLSILIPISWRFMNSNLIYLWDLPSREKILEASSQQGFISINSKFPHLSTSENNFKQKKTMYSRCFSIKEKDFLLLIQQDRLIPLLALTFWERKPKVALAKELITQYGMKSSRWN